MKKEIGTLTLEDITIAREAMDENLIMSKLKELGVLVIEGYADNSTLENLRAEFGQMLESENTDFLTVRPYSLGQAVLLSRTENLRKQFPDCYDFFSADLMKNLTAKYLGDSYTSNDKIFVVKDVVGSKHHANDLHFDVQRTLKFFLYLNDTTSENGAFRCVPGSNQITGKIRKESPDKISYENREFSRMLPFKDSDTIAVEGKAGALIIFDTDVFHQAGTVSQGERWVMRGQSEPEASTISKQNINKPTFFQKIKNRLFR